jgi:hypothetical protein
MSYMEERKISMTDSPFLYFDIAAPLLWNGFS